MQEAAAHDQAARERGRRHGRLTGGAVSAQPMADVWWASPLSPLQLECSVSVSLFLTLFGVIMYCIRKRVAPIMTPERGNPFHPHRHTTAVHPTREDRRAPPLPYRIPTRRVLGVGGGQTSSRVRPAPVPGTEIKRESDNARSQQNATDFLFPDVVNRLQGHCCGPWDYPGARPGDDNACGRVCRGWLLAAFTAGVAVMSLRGSGAWVRGRGR